MTANKIDGVGVDREKSPEVSSSEIPPAEVLTEATAASVVIDALNGDLEMTSEQRMRAEFLKRTFLVAEDVQETNDAIKGQLNEACSGEAERPVILSATSKEGVVAQAKVFFETAKGGEILSVILDFNMPLYEDEDMPDPTSGPMAGAEISREIEKWNNENPDKEPIQLEIYFNSSEDEATEKNYNSKKIGIDPKYIKRYTDQMPQKDGIFGRNSSKSSVDYMKQQFSK